MNKIFRSLKCLSLLSSKGEQITNVNFLSYSSFKQNQHIKQQSELFSIAGGKKTV